MRYANGRRSSHFPGECGAPFGVPDLFADVSTQEKSDRGSEKKHKGIPDIPVGTEVCFEFPATMFVGVATVASPTKAVSHGYRFGPLFPDPSSPLKTKPISTRLIKSAPVFDLTRLWSVRECVKVLFIDAKDGLLCWYQAVVQSHTPDHTWYLVQYAMDETDAWVPRTNVYPN